MATHIGGVALDYPLYVSSELSPSEYLAKKSVAIDGSTTMWLQQKGTHTREVMLFSSDDGWQEEPTRLALLAAVSIDPVTISFDDGSSAVYIFDHTKIPMKFTQLYDGACWYRVDINLLKQ